MERTARNANRRIHLSPHVPSFSKGLFRKVINGSLLKINHCLIATLLSLSLSSQAALIEHDLYATGDGLLTYDTQTGLEWLDLTETFRQRVSTIQSDDFLRSLGFQIKNVSDVYNLFTSASSYRLINDSGSVINYIFDDAIAASQLLSLGQTNGDGVIRRDIRGWALRDETSNTFDAMMGLFTGTDSKGFATQGNIKEVRFGSSSINSGANMGVFLAREIPSPATHTLMLIGLIAIRFGIIHTSTKH